MILAPLKLCACIGVLQNQELAGFCWNRLTVEELSLACGSRNTSRPGMRLDFIWWDLILVKPTWQVNRSCLQEPMNSRIVVESVRGLPVFKWMWLSFRSKWLWVPQLQSLKDRCTARTETFSLHWLDWHSHVKVRTASRMCFWCCSHTSPYRLIFRIYQLATGSSLTSYDVSCISCKMMIWHLMSISEHS